MDALHHYVGKGIVDHRDYIHVDQDSGQWGPLQRVERKVHIVAHSAEIALAAAKYQLNYGNNHAENVTVELSPEPCYVVLMLGHVQ